MQSDTLKNAYQQLNKEQQDAVDTIDGPVMVIAGPGTGKTQLLALRTARILEQDNTMLPGNILCLTFTDAASANMRERLIRYIGQDAYQVGIYTFNSFGSYIINSYPEFFYGWRETQVADELATYRILESILETLPGDHMLAGRGVDGSYHAIRQLNNFIQDAKRANYTPQELRALLAANEAAYKELSGSICGCWPPSIRGEKAVQQLMAIAKQIDDLAIEESGDTPLLRNMICESFMRAAAAAEQSDARDRTKPFTAWKKEWLEKDSEGAVIFKGSKHCAKLNEAITIYEQYQLCLQTQELIDFADQIMWVLDALEKKPELRMNLQERYQYIMIDEYQDTNRAQLQLARYLTDSPVHEGRPNILAVGDDDQAIYRFQGADLSNIGMFESLYTNPKIIMLKQNYRSCEDILDHSRTIRKQLALSLEQTRGFIKELSANVPASGKGAILTDFDHESQHYAWIAKTIQELIKNGTAGNEIAVLARTRQQLDLLVPYLRERRIAMDYERRENILDQPHITILVTLAKLVLALSEQRLDDANALLPEVLSHPMWGIEPKELWLLSRTAAKEKKQWLDIIFEIDGTKLKHTADFLLSVAMQAPVQTLEQSIDLLVGIEETAAADSDFDDTENGEVNTLSIRSPFKNYYFREELFDKNPESYLALLSNLATLRYHVRNYHAADKRVLTLKDFLEFINACQRAGILLRDRAPHKERLDAVRLMTAHKAKGLEFDNVFVIGLTDEVWGKKGGGNKRFSYPQNLYDIRPSENDDDDALRLLFVSMTRARQSLYLSSYTMSEDGTQHQLFAPLLALQIESIKPDIEVNSQSLVDQFEQRWFTRHVSAMNADKSALMADTLQGYTLSATHMNNFLNVTEGGPAYFFMQNLLHFPSGMNAHAMYGNAVHETLHYLHGLATRNEPTTPETAAIYFQERLALKPLQKVDFERFLTQGKLALKRYIQTAHNDFLSTQRSEVSFDNQGVVIGSARLKGTIDMLDFHELDKTIEVTDYKTGKSFSRWTVGAKSGEYDRIKLHKFHSQLLFYKLLIDESADWGKRGWQATVGHLRFVEPDQNGDIKTLSVTYEADEVARMKQLVTAVWQHIMDLNFPDCSTYEPTAEGITAFENDLIDGKI